MSEQDVKDRYAKEPWGRFLLSMGWEPYDTESRARTVAGEAAERLEKHVGAVICFDLCRNILQTDLTIKQVGSIYNRLKRAWDQSDKDEYIKLMDIFVGLPFYGEDSWNRLVNMTCSGEWDE